MTDRETKQMPIYFVSRALRGLERSYTSMEKLVLALVHASKRLKRYFESHPIIVITDQPIQQVLSRPEVAGRLQKWIIELGEYAIHYRPRVSVKGKILEDFIVEWPKEDSLDTLIEIEEELPDPWILFLDGSSCTDGSGAGLILTNPKGHLEEEPAPTRETSAPPAPKTAKQLAAKRNHERVKSILLLAIPDEYLLKFHNVADAKSLWEAIKSRFGGNEAMQEEPLLFKLQKVWILVDFPSGKKAIGTKWVFKNKRDERSIVVKNKARLVAQGFRQEEGINYDKVFAPVARIEAIRLFLAFASYMGFTVYQMDVKSAFLYGTIEEEVYVHQPPGFVDPPHPNKVYKVIKALYGLHQAPRAWYETLSSFLMENGFRRGLQVKQQPDGIFISQDKYVADILKKFDFWSIRTTTTPIESNKPLVKDEDGEDVNVHVYRSMIGSLMYLTASRPDIMDSPFELEAFSDSDYRGASLDRKSTTGSYQFLGRRLISWISMDWRMDRKLLKLANSTHIWHKHNMVAFLKKPNESVGFTKFWQIVTVRILANGTQQLITSIDSKEYTITEASVRSKLQLADAIGIHNLSDAEIYAGLATLGSYEAPLPEGNTSGSDEASIQLKELMVLVPSLVTRVTSLEKELKDTKQTLGNVMLKLAKKVKSLEKALKMKSKKVIVSASEGKEPEDQGRIIQDIDDDPLVSLVRESIKDKSTDFVTPTKASGDAQEEEISPTILEAAKTLSKFASQSVSKAKSTDKGKRYRRRARSMAKKINTGLDAEDEINTGRVEINSGIEDVNTVVTKVDTGRTINYTSKNSFS
ncbi:putative ribonuclease H-like domain-containing protein [Tanacetum coccineum]